jgi:hypothetical protein
MARQTRTASETKIALQRIAMRYPEAQEGIACAGTAVESRTVRVRNKAFLFLGKNHLMVKLRESLAEATKLGSKAPERYKVGAGGWVKVTFGDVEITAAGILERWIGESYRLLAPKQLAALLPGGGPAIGDGKKVVKKIGAKSKRGKKNASSR